jgi:polysaccharide deacetylase 2 family uncharacterized protein YibQ
MGDNNILPKGGFFRGVLAGLTLISLIFIGLAIAFPLIVATSPEPVMATELDNTPAQAAPEIEESSSGINVNTDPPSPMLLGSTPALLGESSPVVVSIEPETAAPVNTVSQLQAVPTNDIQIGSSVSAPPVISSPTVPVIEAPIVSETLTIDKPIEAPSVSSEIAQASTENDITTEPQITEQAPEPTIIAEAPTVTEEPGDTSGGLELTGQTLITATEPTQPDSVEVSEPAQNTAFNAFSAAFTDDGELPLMSFILLATTVAESEVISSFSTPVTLAVASDNPAAKDIIENYRASGGEVVLLLPSEGANALRKGGNPSDAPAFLDAALANTEGVIGVMDGPDGDVNQDTRMISAMVAKLSETGHAIMTVNGLGLNRTSILATESGVPATDISRAIDTNNGTIAVVRALDKIVLQIGDQKSVTIYTESNPDMLFALKFWLESEKAKSVTIAPVSASILRN